MYFECIRRKPGIHVNSDQCDVKLVRKKAIYFYVSGILQQINKRRLMTILVTLGLMIHGQH